MDKTYSQRWSFYSHKYGVIHAATSFLGRKAFWTWKLLGPMVTRRYLRDWLRERPEGGRVVNLGGGSNVREEWLTADIDPRADVYVDIQKDLPFEDNSLDAIFLEEVFEHVSYVSARKLLLECRRVLRPEGVIRLSTPDLAWIVSCWQKGKKHSPGIVLTEAEKMLGEYADAAGTIEIAAINALFYSHGHRFIYDKASLREQLMGAGFAEPRFSRYKEIGSVMGQYDTHADRFNHAPELSLYAEARKASDTPSSLAGRATVAARA